MALALVAESAVSAVIENVISEALSYVSERIAGPSSMQDEIRRLEEAFPRIRTILRLVEQGQTVTTEQDDQLDAWLWQLRDAVDQAEDVLDEMDYYELEKAVQAGDHKVQEGTALNFTRKFVDFATNISRNGDTLERLRGAVKALDYVAGTSETLLQLVSQLYNSDVKRQHEDEIRNARETSSFLTEDTIFGRDTEKARIVEWLTKPTSDEPENASATVGKVSAFVIVGMGGLGKTTLAQFIYHDEQVQEFFDLVLWVCVSDQFDVAKLTKKILEEAGVDEKDLGDKSLTRIQDILQKKLISKKFLLVLDDVWNDDDKHKWEQLVAPLTFGKKGSKILLTTRMDSVAKRVANVLQCKEEFLKLSGLEEVDFMHLFNTHAFAGENIDDHRNLQLIDQQIAEKLGGCPLAAKILGGCLNSRMDENYWRRILNENFLNLQESEDNIRMILRLSYQQLPISLQICFRYCSIFPKDHEFEKNELIHMWIGSGLIKKQVHGTRSLEDIGEEYLNHLARKSLFDIKISKYSSDCKQHYVMHDLLHDLAQLVSSGECLGIEDDGLRDIPETIRHLYVNKVNPHMISHLKNLRTLIIWFNNDCDVVGFNEVLSELKSLRFLRVVTADDYEFPDEVGKLIHLRYLSLSSGRVSENESPFLPQSVCRLYHLEVMELQGGIKIDDSTRDRMSNLVKLRLLHTPYHIMDKIPWIGKLTSLQELDNFRVREECGYMIDQLKNLQNLRKLHIGGLENVRSPEEAADANLIEKKNLDELLLNWSTNRSGGLEVDEPLLDNLRPHTNLKELEIEGYARVRSPCWMTAKSCLSNIRSIKLSNCQRWENLPPFGQLPLLRFLNLQMMWSVKKLCCSRSVGGCAFPSLEKLRLIYMPDLESFEGEHMFPLLNELVIIYCPSLKGLPALPLTLNQLDIRMVGLTSLPTMQHDCSSCEGRASCSSSHPTLSKLSICECPNLTSLDGFMLQQQYFPALKSLSINECENLRHLPEKFFQKLPFLKALIIRMCPNLMMHGILDNRLPKTLERLTLVSNGDLDLPLLESLPKLTALRYLQIGGCADMTSLPPAEVFPRLSTLSILNCKELSSLDGLQALPSLQSVYIEGCDKLIGLSLGVTSTSHTDMVLRPPMEQLRYLKIDRPALLRVEPLRSLSSVSELTIYDGTELTSLDEQWLLQNRNSLQHFEIRKASALVSLPTSMIDLQALRRLEIHDAPLLQTISELPTSMISLFISGYRPELEEYIKGSGKFANIRWVQLLEEKSLEIERASYTGNMAFALVAQSALSAVIEKLISKAVSYVQEHGAVQEEIQRLQRAFPQIQDILTFVEQGQTADTTKQNDVLDAWLWQLRDAVDQAEDVLDEMEYYELEKEVQAGDNKVQQDTALDLKRKYADFTNNIFGNDDTLKRLREAMKALDNVAATSETLLQLVLQLYNSDVKRQQENVIRSTRETSSLLTEDTIIFGRDTEKERIVEWLTNPTSDEPENASAAVGKVPAFTIVGMGGLGKTTLAQLIYHDEKVRQCFDLVLWVCVSDQFDVAMLTRKILEAAEVRDSLGDKSLNKIQDILKEKLISKKFLLVLDDVWNDDKIHEWEKLVGPLKFGKKGSKILLTTRMDSVAAMVANVLQSKKESLKLSGLEKVDFMHLFNTHAFARVNIDDHRNLQLIGQQIAKKLGGCPLAAKHLGRCLNSCLDKKYWRRILNENFLSLQESEDNIRMILRLSYHHLPTSLKICFRYCSIFPKGHEFEKNELIRMWIGSGLIKKPIHEKRSLEDIGEQYLYHLARKSLFDIKISEHSSDCKQRYVMHDLLHDLAQLVSSGECLGIEDDGFRDIPETIRHLYVKTVPVKMLNPVNRVNPLMISHLKNLRTLIIHLNKDYDVAVFNEVLKELKSLRLLRVTTDDYKFPDEVGKLIHLRYLSLRSFGYEESILPQSVCRLYHLEAMELQGSTKIDDSTLDRMSNLVKLRLLHTPHQIMDKIPWIGKLTSLQELDNFRVGEECGYKIDQLKNLQNLRRLRIEGLENVRSSEEAADANLIEKRNLDELSLNWSWERSGSLEVDEPLLDNLRPHANLKELAIQRYAGVRSPCWMTATSLSNVRSISLSDCERWEDLSTLGQLPLLKLLNLQRMRAVKKLCCSRSVGGYAFPSLKELHLREMLDLEWFKGEHMFPWLNELHISDCPSLKGLPALPLTLSQLNISRAGLTSLPMMQQDCSSGQGQASCASSHPALSELTIRACKELSSLDGLQALPSLKTVSIHECDKLIQLSLGVTSTSPTDMVLRPPMDLHIRDCKELLSVDGLQALPSLTDLSIDGCPKLSVIRIRNCKELSSLDGLQALPSLRTLSIKGCDKLIELLQGATSTSHTDTVQRPSMEQLSVFPALRHLFIFDSPLLRTIPELPTSMKALYITGCHPELEEYIEGSEKYANIPRVTFIENSSDDEKASAELCPPSN